MIARVEEEIPEIFQVKSKKREEVNTKYLNTTLDMFEEEEGVELFSSIKKGGKYKKNG